MIDRGHGYDKNDSFVDDSEVVSCTNASREITFSAVQQLIIIVTGKQVSLDPGFLSWVGLTAKLKGTI